MIALPPSRRKPFLLSPPAPKRKTPPELRSWRGALHRLGQCCLCGSGRDKPTMVHPSYRRVARHLEVRIAKIASDVATRPYGLAL